MARARVLAGPPPAVGCGGGPALFGHAQGPSGNTAPAPDTSLAIQVATLKLLRDISGKKKRGVPGLTEADDSDEDDLPAFPGSNGPQLLLGSTPP